MHLGIARSHSIGLLLAAALVGHASAQDANNCEAIRAQIESKIAVSGVVGFSVTVVDANATVEGQVVGRCALGTRKIVYLRPSSASTDSPSMPAQRRGSAVLTECRDGSMPVGGNCKP